MNIDVHKTLKKIPTENIAKLVVVTVTDDNEMVVNTCADSDRETAEILWGAYELYDPIIDLTLED